MFACLRECVRLSCLPVPEVRFVVSTCACVFESVCLYAIVTSKYLPPVKFVIQSQEKMSVVFFNLIGLYLIYLIVAKCVSVYRQLYNYIQSGEVSG